MPRKKLPGPFPVPVAVRGVLVAVVDVWPWPCGHGADYRVSRRGLDDLDRWAGDWERAARSLAVNWPGGLDHESAYRVLWSGGES